MNTLKKALIFLFGSVTLFFSNSANLMAQCAMCRATVENNVNNGDIGIAAGLNLGILYLFVAPYITFAVIAFFWFRISKRNARKKHIKSSIGI